LLRLHWAESETIGPSGWSPTPGAKLYALSRPPSVLESRLAKLVGLALRLRNRESHAAHAANLPAFSWRGRRRTGLRFHAVLRRYCAVPKSELYRIFRVQGRDVRSRSSELRSSELLCRTDKLRTEQLRTDLLTESTCAHCPEGFSAFLPMCAWASTDSAVIVSPLMLPVTFTDLPAKSANLS